MSSPRLAQYCSGLPPTMAGGQGFRRWPRSLSPHECMHHILSFAKSDKNQRIEFFPASSVSAFRSVAATRCGLDVLAGKPQAGLLPEFSPTTNCPIRIPCPLVNHRQSPMSSDASRRGRHGRQSPHGRGLRRHCRCQSDGHRRRSCRRTPCDPSGRHQNRDPSGRHQNRDPSGRHQSPSCRHGRRQSPSCRHGRRGLRGHCDRCDSHLGHLRDRRCGTHHGHLRDHHGHHIRDARRLCRDRRGTASRCRDPPPRGVCCVGRQTGQVE